MPTACLYKFKKNSFLVHALVRTKSGFSIPANPYLIIDMGINDEELINAVKLCLKTDDEMRVPNPDNWSDHNRDFLSNIGLKSTKQLYALETQYLLISLNNNQLIFLPTIHSVDGAGYDHKKKGEAVEVSIDSSNQEIMACLNLALVKCNREE